MPSGQDFFSLQELLFIAMVLGTLATLGGIGIAALVRTPPERGRPWPALRWLGLAVGLYLVVVLAFSLKPPVARVAHKGDPQCLAPSGRRRPASASPAHPRPSREAVPIRRPF